MCRSAVIVNQGQQALSQGISRQSSARWVSQLSTSGDTDISRRRNRESCAVKQHPCRPVQTASAAPPLHPAGPQLPPEPLLISPQLCPMDLPQGSAPRLALHCQHTPTPCAEQGHSLSTQLAIKILLGNSKREAKFVSRERP